MNAYDELMEFLEPGEEIEVRTYEVFKPPGGRDPGMSPIPVESPGGRMAIKELCLYVEGLKPSERGEYRVDVSTDRRVIRMTFNGEAVRIDSVWVPGYPGCTPSEGAE